MKTYRTFSSAETKKIGELLAGEVIKGPYGRAITISLQGDLGAGKTTFTQGFLTKLGITRRIPSPTFVIMKRYAIAHPQFKNAHHMDAYRLRTAMDTEPLKLKEILKDPRNIVLIEWPENIKGMLPRGTRKVTFKYGKKENERIIKM